MDIGKKRHLTDRRNAQRVKYLLRDINQNQLQDSMTNMQILRPIRKVNNSMFLSKTPTSFEGDDEDSCNTSYILSAEGYGRLVWDLLVMTALILQSFYIPFCIGFTVPLRGSLLYVDFLITVAFLIDILLSFNTTFYKSGTLVKNRKVIALNYIKGWFWIDLIASFPYDWVVNQSIFIEDQNSDDNEMFQPGFNSSKLVRMIQILRLFRMVKLIRLAKLKVIILKIEDLLYNEFLANLFIYARLGTIVFFMAHWTACIWFFASCQSLTTVSESWVVEMESNYGYTSNLLENYVTSLYWAFTTMITIGYGDIHAHSVNERIAAMVSMCLACGFFSFIVGNISSLISTQNAHGRDHRETFLSVNKFMSKKKLPYELQFKIRRYLDYVFEHHNQKDLDEHQILELISEPLRDEIYLCTYGKILISYKIFPLLFSSTIIAQLTKLFNPETFAPGDIVIEEDKKDRQINFIISGNVNIFHKKSNSLLKSLTIGAYFGEIGFFADHKRTASAKCINFTELLTLNYKNIMSQFEKNPNAKEALNLIEMKCRDGDYSELDVRCYLCKAKGHVALKCQKILFNLDNENTKQKWLAERNVRAKVLNPYIDMTPNFHRKHRNVRQLSNILPITGKDKEPNQLYPRHSSLISKIREFRSKSTDVSSVHSLYPGSFMSGISTEHPNIMDIYTNSEEEEIEDKPHIMEFDRSLICLDSILKSCRSEGDADLYLEEEFNHEFSFSDACPYYEANSFNEDASSTSLMRQSPFNFMDFEK